MVHGIMTRRAYCGTTEVMQAENGTEEELEAKINEMLEKNFDARDEFSFFDLEEEKYDRDRWSLTIKGEQYTYQLGLGSLFSSDFFTLLDYIKPHMLTAKFNRYDEVCGWEINKRRHDTDIRFTAYDTRGGDDGIGGFAHQVLFEIKLYPYGEHVDSIFVLCGYQSSGWEDNWDHYDSFSAERVLLTLTEKYNMKGWRMDY